MNIQMVDLHTQYLKIQQEIDHAILRCLQSSRFIGGEEVSSFCSEMAAKLQVAHFVGCGNGTDALQIALMSLDLEAGDEVIIPAFTYAAPAEVVALMHLRPVFIDVSPEDFNINLEGLEELLTPMTKAIIPVHLFGQAAEMDPILQFAEKHGLKVIEDNAQSVLAEYSFPGGVCQKTGTMGHIGTFSFFPAKNLACYGDGGGLCTNEDQLAEKITLVANHGQKKKYFHEIIGINSRLDAIQAAILRVKLKYLEDYTKARQMAARWYREQLKTLDMIILPKEHPDRSHVYHQFMIRVKEDRRDALNQFLSTKGIPSMVYYPLPLYRQKAYERFWDGRVLPNAERLCRDVLSLPMHTELTEEQIEYIAEQIKVFFTK